MPWFEAARQRAERIRYDDSPRSLPARDEIKAASQIVVVVDAG